MQSLFKPLLHLMADVANTCPFEPTPRTMIEAMTTIKSVYKKKVIQGKQKLFMSLSATKRDSKASA